MTIGEKILELRKTKGVSQETMAFDLAVSRQAVSKWETDQSIPDLDKIKALSEYFNVSIDYLVNDVKTETVDGKESIDLNKTNYVKRIVRIMLKTSIAFYILKFVYLLYVTIFQKSFIDGYLFNENTPFVFPWGSYIEFVIYDGFYIFVAFYLLKQLNEDTKIIKDKIIILIVYAILQILSFAFSTIEQLILNTYNNEEIMRIYLELYNIINIIQKSSLGLGLSTIMLVISIALIIAIKIYDGTRYRLPTIIKEYKARDSVLSFLIAFFCGIPGLLFEIMWLKDAKTDNEFRFKKMRFWYIIGFIIPLIVSFWLLLVQILERL